MRAWPTAAALRLGRGMPDETEPPAYARARMRRQRPMKRAWPIVVASVVLALAVALYTQRPQAIFERTGDFGRVRVVEAADGLRTLYTGDGRARQSAVYPGRPDHLQLAYSRVGMIGLALVPADARILFVGLGGGAMPMYARHMLPQADIEVVEIDPLIVDVAQRYFGFRQDVRMRVHTDDGRAFLEDTAPATYDLIVLDAFSDDEVPRALTTRQFLETVRSRLTPGGVVVSNLWSGNPVYPSMVATYGAVFEDVHLVKVPGRDQRILVAPAEGQLERAALVQAARSLAARVDLGFDLPALVEQGYERPELRAAPVLEDDQAGARLRAGPIPLPGAAQCCSTRRFSTVPSVLWAKRIPYTPSVAFSLPAVTSAPLS